MYAVQYDTTGKPYSLFVAKYTVANSGNVRSLSDIALRTWKSESAAQRWIDSRQAGNHAAVVSVPT